MGKKKKIFIFSLITVLCFFRRLVEVRANGYASDMCAFKYKYVRKSGGKKGTRIIRLGQVAGASLNHCEPAITRPGNRLAPRDK